MKLLLIAVLLNAAAFVSCFPTGAPVSACGTVSPNAASHGAQTQSSQIPYTLNTGTLAADGYVPGQTYTLTLSGNSGEQFRGFLVQSRQALTNDFIASSFSGLASNTQFLVCDGQTASSVTHNSRSDKSSVSFTWTGPSAGTGNVIFRFAVVRVRNTYWANQATATISERVAVDPPTITAQPADQLDVAPGADATFTVQATGAGTLTYQWQRNSVDIANAADTYSGAATATLTVLTANEEDEGAFRCVVSNSGGSTTSATAQLTVVDIDPPTIAAQPADQLDVAPGADATFAVQATGAGTLTYQWQRNSADIANAADTYSGATTATLTVLTANEEDEGAFRCVVSNSGGSITSATAQLTVVDIDPPTITAQPADQLDVAPGADATFTVQATGAGTLTYQWQRNSADIANAADTYSEATTATLTVLTANEEDEGAFRCVVSNSGGSTTSGTAQLTVVDIDVTITTQPAAQLDVLPGEDAMFSVAATSAIALSYQWQRDLVNLVDSADTYSGVTTNMLTVLSVAESDEGSYRCVISATDVGSTFSDSVELAVRDPPIVSASPVDQANVNAGDNVTFTVAATGVGLTYQWQKDGSDVTDSQNTYSGSTSSSLVVITVEESDEGTFRCAIANGAGNVTSAEATLTVGPDPTMMTTDGATQQVAVLSLTVVLMAALVAALSIEL